MKRETSGAKGHLESVLEISAVRSGKLAHLPSLQFGGVSRPWEGPLAFNGDPVEKSLTGTDEAHIVNSRGLSCMHCVGVLEGLFSRTVRGQGQDQYPNSQRIHSVHIVAHNYIFPKMLPLRATRCIRIFSQNVFV